MSSNLDRARSYEEKVGKKIPPKREVHSTFILP